MTQLDLNGQWRVVLGPEIPDMPMHPKELDTCTWTEIPAQVPGNIELDLYRAGMEGEPFWGGRTCISTGSMSITVFGTGGTLPLAGIVAIGN